MQARSMSLFTTLAAVAAALLLAATLAAPAPMDAQPISLRLHTHVPPAAASFKSLQWWAHKVEAETGGRLKIQLFGSNQLGGKAEDIYDQVRNGVVDIGWTLPGYNAAVFPATSAFELPFIGGEAAIVSQALDAYARKWGKAEWSAVHPIVFHAPGVSVLHMKTRPIETLADLKGLKIRTSSPISSATLAALGAIPVPIPRLRIAEALARDIVDGAVAPWSIALEFRTIETAKFHTETYVHGPTLVMVMNKNSYAKLPADLKKVIDANSGRWLAKEFGMKWANGDARGRSKAIMLKHPVATLSGQEEARWRWAAQPVYDNWIKEIDARGLPGKQMVEDAERLVAKFKAAAK